MNKEQIKLAFFDVDHTMYDHENNEIPPLHLQAIQMLHKQGIKVCLCTGRPFMMLKNLGILDVFDWDGLVCGNGAAVYDQTYQPLFEQPIPYKSAKQIFSIAKEKGWGLLAAGSNRMFITQDDPITMDMVHGYNCTNVQVDTLKESDDLSVICVATTKEDRFTHKPELDNIPYVQPLYNSASLDLKREGLTKFDGIQLLIQNLSPNKTDYIAFGDSLNDWDMLKNAKISVAMGNAEQRIKDMTDAICPTCQQGGIYHYLKEEGWLE